MADHLTPARASEIRRRLEAATPGPWIDLTETYARRMREDHKMFGRWWHGNRRHGTPIFLIASGMCRGEPVTPERIPKAVDRWDLTTVLQLWWGDLPRRTSVFYGHRQQDLDLIAAAPSDLRALLDFYEAAVDLLRELKMRRDDHGIGYSEDIDAFLPEEGA